MLRVYCIVLTIHRTPQHRRENRFRVIRRSRERRRSSGRAQLCPKDWPRSRLHVRRIHWCPRRRILRVTTFHEFYSTIYKWFLFIKRIIVILFLINCLLKRDFLKSKLLLLKEVWQIKPRRQELVVEPLDNQNGSQTSQGLF